MRKYFKQRKTTILIFLLFLGVAVFLTWPLLPNLFGKLYGEAGDPVNAAWSFRWFRETALSLRGGALHYPYAGYPHGVEAYLPLPLLYMPLTLITYLPRGETITYNLIILVAMALNGFIMYLLGEKLFKNKYVAVAMGLIYILCPYALVRARYHHTLVGIFIFPLVIYALLKLREDSSTRSKVVYFITMLLALNIHPYYTCMVVFMLALLFIHYLVRKSRKGELRDSYGLMRDCLLLTLAAAAITTALFYIQFTATNDSLSAISRREGDLYTYAAQTWYYLVPSPHSAFLGEAAHRLLGGKVISVNIEEYVIFLGYTNLCLALSGTFLWISRRYSRLVSKATAGLRDNAAWLIPFAWILGVASFIFSLPPTLRIGGVTLYLPSWFVYRVFPFMRVYARFGVMVFFSVTLLSGACLYFLANLFKLRVSRRAVGALVLSLLLVLVLAEFLEVGKDPMQDLYRPDALYTDVRDLGEGSVIAEYPFVASDESFNSLYLWNQFYHHKMMLNGYAPGTEGEAMRLTVVDLLDPRTPALLAYMGADYVTVHKDMYVEGSEYSYRADRIELEALPSGLQMVKEYEDSALLRVSSEKPAVVVLYDPKCSLAYLPGMNPGLWLQFGKEWTIKIDALEDMTVDVEFSIYSVEGDRDLRLETGQGEEIRKIVGNALEKITIPGLRLEEGVNEIYLSTTAEQVPHKEVFGGYDSKPISFVMSFWEVKRVSPGPAAE